MYLLRLFLRGNLLNLYECDAVFMTFTAPILQSRFCRFAKSGDFGAFPVYENISVILTFSRKSSIFMVQSSLSIAPDLHPIYKQKAFSGFSMVLSLFVAAVVS